MSNIAVRGSKQVITNIGDLLEALAIGWSKRESERRLLITSAKNWGGQFVRTPESVNAYPYYMKREGDISVDSGAYSMTGFIKFEAESMFPGWFEKEHADDGVWASASLTEFGYQQAKLGLIPFNHGYAWLKSAPFFLPPVRSTVEALPWPDEKQSLLQLPENSATTKKVRP